jgi:hypothetical protein
MVRAGHGGKAMERAGIEPNRRPPTARQGLRGGVAGGDLALRGDPLPLPADYAVDRAEAIALGTVTS